MPLMPETIVARMVKWGGICKLMCLNAGLFAIAAEPDKATASISGLHEPQPLRFMHSASSAPDPAPPKPSTLQ